MNKKVLFIFSAALIISVSYGLIAIPKNQKREPIIINGYASMEELSLDNLIDQADIIVVGELVSTHTSRWNTENGKLPNNITAKNIYSKFIIYTDQIFNPNLFIKGNPVRPIRIRYFGGQIDQDVMTVSGEVRLEDNKNYLLFLIEDTLGTTAQINKGHYIVLGSTQGVYEISGTRASSSRDEWNLEELVSYIQSKLAESGTSPSSVMPEGGALPTPEGTNVPTP